jgi:maltooligosyltrehalose trehalohydrolase
VASGTKERLRRVSVGAELLPDGGADVRVWAPACQRLDLVRADTKAILAMEREPDGHFHVVDPDARGGGRYWFRLDDGRLRPDPASRHQPEGPHRASAYVDPRAFRWTDADWPGVGRDGHVMYELHVGTFTPEGTWRAGAEQLEALARLGITVVEMMPIAEFPGRFGWGYDGVGLYAPMHAYGTPDDLRGFVDRAHGIGLAVIVDVVYNHLGPDGNYLHEFSPDYFTDKYKNDWGRDQFRGSAGGAPVLRSERRLLDRRVPFRRFAPRCDAGHERRVASSRHRGSRRNGAQSCRSAVGIHRG